MQGKAQSQFIKKWRLAQQQAADAQQQAQAELIHLRLRTKQQVADLQQQVQVQAANALRAQHDSAAAAVREADAQAKAAHAQHAFVLHRDVHHPEHVAEVSSLTVCNSCTSSGCNYRHTLSQVKPLLSVT